MKRQCRITLSFLQYYYFSFIVFLFMLRPDGVLFKMEVEDGTEEEMQIGVTGTGDLEEGIRRALSEKISRQTNSPGFTQMCIISLNAR